MSHDSQAAHDLRDREASDTQEEELKVPRIDSDIRELAPGKAANETAAGVRGKVKEVAETREPTSFEDAMKSLEPVEYGDHAALLKLAYQYSGEKLIVCRTEKGKGFKAFAREAKEDETLPLSPEQSQELANAINKKIDFEKMEKQAGKKKKKRKVKPARPASKKEKQEKESRYSVEELTAAIPKIHSKSELGKLLDFAESKGLCRVDKSGTRLVITEAEGVDGSTELAAAFNAQFDAIREADHAERNRKQVEWATRMMGNAKNTPHLRKIIEGRLNHMIEVKDGQQRHEWTVSPKSQSPRDLEVAQIATKKKAELREAFFQQRQREDVDRILRKARR